MRYCLTTSESFLLSLIHSDLSLKILTRSVLERIPTSDPLSTTITLPIFLDEISFRASLARALEGTDMIFLVIISETRAAGRS